MKHLYHITAWEVAKSLENLTATQCGFKEAIQTTKTARLA